MSVLKVKDPTTGEWIRVSGGGGSDGYAREAIGVVDKDEDVSSLFVFEGRYLTLSGGPGATDGSICTDYIPVRPGDTFLWSGTTMPKFGYAACVFDADKNFLVGDSLTDLSEIAVKNVLFTVPTGGAYVRFHSIDKTKAALYRTKNYDGIAEIVDMTETYCENATARYIDKLGAVGDSSSAMLTDFIPVTEDDTFLVTAMISGYNACCVFYDSEKTFAGARLISDAPASYVQEVFEAAEVVIPKKVAYIRFSTMDTAKYPLCIRKYVPLSLRTSDHRLYGYVEELRRSNVLWGKKYVACGDSFTQGDFTGYVDANGNSGTKSDAWDPVLRLWKTYPWHIADRNGMTLVNEALCGTDFVNIDGAVNPFSVERYLAVPADADYITLMFGLNEVGLEGANLGTKEDTDNTTLWGAYNLVFEHFLTHMPYAKIGVIIADAWMTETYAAAVREICRYWGIPYLDLKEDTVPMGLGGRYGEVSPKAVELRNAAFQVAEDNQHPNYRAHVYRSTIIEDFLRRL